MKEIITYYGIRWYWVFILYVLVVLNRIIEIIHPAFSLSAKENVTAVSETLIDILLKGTFIGLLFYFIPGNRDIDRAEKLRRSISLGFVIWFIIFS